MRNPLCAFPHRLQSFVLTLICVFIVTIIPPFRIDSETTADALCMMLKFSHTEARGRVLALVLHRSTAMSTSIAKIFTCTIVWMCLDEVLNIGVTSKYIDQFNVHAETMILAVIVAARIRLYGVMPLIAWLSVEHHVIDHFLFGHFFTALTSTKSTHRSHQ